MLKGVSVMKTAFIIHSIRGYESFKEWQIASVENTHLSSNSSKAIQVIWGVKEHIRPIKVVLSPYLRKLFIPRLYPQDTFLDICQKYDIRPDHIAAFTHVIFGLLLREGVLPTQVKSKSLIIAGAPNTGKTSMITAISKFLDPCVFHRVGSRKNDFTGFKASQRPLLL